MADILSSLFIYIGKKGTRPEYKYTYRSILGVRIRRRRIIWIVWNNSTSVNTHTFIYDTIQSAPHNEKWNFTFEFYLCSWRILGMLVLYKMKNRSNTILDKPFMACVPCGLDETPFDSNKTIFRLILEPLNLINKPLMMMNRVYCT